MNHIKQLYEFVYKHAGNNTHVPSDANVDELINNIRSVAYGFFKGRKPAISPSQLAQPARKLAMLHSGVEAHNPDEFKPTSRVKMFVSSVTEFLIVFLMKEAGVNISDEQRKIKIKIEDDKGNVLYEMKGSNDYAIDGKIRDFKCTDQTQYKTKWKNLKSLLENDSFGYELQGEIYRLGAEQEGWANEMSGWDVLNLATGEMRAIDTKNNTTDLTDLKLKLDNVKKFNWEDFEHCYEPWRDKQGVRKLNWKCARCKYVSLCWPEAKMEKNNINHVNYILED